MRAFIAIEIPEAIKEGVAAVSARLESAGVDARWSRPEGVHLTLKFLGDVGEERVPEILQALARALGNERNGSGSASTGSGPSRIRRPPGWSGSGSPASVAGCSRSRRPSRRLWPASASSATPERTRRI